jgi:hypothetical protein
MVDSCWFHSLVLKVNTTKTLPPCPVTVPRYPGTRPGLERELAWTNSVYRMDAASPGGDTKKPGNIDPGSALGLGRLVWENDRTLLYIAIFRVVKTIKFRGLGARKPGLGDLFASLPNWSSSIKTTFSIGGLKTKIRNWGCLQIWTPLWLDGLAMLGWPADQPEVPLGPNTCQWCLKF